MAAHPKQDLHELTCSLHTRKRLLPVTERGAAFKAVHR